MKDYLLKQFLKACSVYQDLAHGSAVDPLDARKARDHFQWLLSDVELIVPNSPEPRIRAGFGDSGKPSTVARAHVEKMFFELTAHLEKDAASVEE